MNQQGLHESAETVLLLYYFSSILAVSQKPFRFSETEKR